MRFNKLVSIATRQRRRMQGVRLTLVRQINSTCDAQESSVIYHLLLFYLHSLLLFLCLRRRHAWGILRMLLAILWLFFSFLFFVCFFVIQSVQLQRAWGICGSIIWCRPLSFIYYFLFNISLFMFYHVESATTACVRRPADSMIPAIIIY
jgi:hypothetical protein